MNIGIIGVGNVGSALGRGWAKAGHKIKFGVRDTAKPEVVALVKEIGANANAASVSDAASFGEVVVLATPWDAAQTAIQKTGNLSGKILVDCTNPLKPDLSGLVLGTDSSAGEQVAKWASAAKVVKSFHTTGAGNLANPRYGNDRIVMFLAGNDAAAKKTVAKLSEDLGFDTIDAGDLTAARLLEPLAMLWIHLAYKAGLG